MHACGLENRPCTLKDRKSVVPRLCRSRGGVEPYRARSLSVVYIESGSFDVEAYDEPFRNVWRLRPYVATERPAVPPAVSASDVRYYIGGLELFPGLRIGYTKRGVLFAGWTLKREGWAPVAESNSGRWMVTVGREGKASFGTLVTITGGTWSMQPPGGPALWGRVLGGVVRWPETDEINDGCGCGVALLDADISLGFPWGLPWRKVGVIKGCLDDQRWLMRSEIFRFPPRIWGTMRF